MWLSQCLSTIQDPIVPQPRPFPVGDILPAMIPIPVLAGETRRCCLPAGASPPPSPKCRIKELPINAAPLQIPTLADFPGAGVCNPDLSFYLLWVKAVPCSWDEPPSGRREDEIPNPQPDTQRV